MIHFPQISRHTKHAFPQRVIVSYIGKEDFWVVEGRGYIPTSLRTQCCPGCAQFLPLFSRTFSKITILAMFPYKSAKGFMSYDRTYKHSYNTLFRCLKSWAWDPTAGFHTTKLMLSHQTSGRVSVCSGNSLRRRLPSMQRRGRSGSCPPSEHSHRESWSPPCIPT